MTLDVDATRVRGVWYRHIPHRGRVWALPTSAPSGRWQRGSAVRALYLADTRDTVWAEWYRHLAELVLRPTHLLPRDLWRFRVDVRRVADLTTVARLERVRLSMPRPSRAEWPAFQAVGETLYEQGWHGVLTQSAARPDDGRILCLFRDAEKVAGVKPIPPPAIYRHPPAPPTGLRT